MAHRLEILILGGQRLGSTIRWGARDPETARVSDRRGSRDGSEIQAVERSGRKISGIGQSGLSKLLTGNNAKWEEW